MQFFRQYRAVAAFLSALSVCVLAEADTGAARPHPRGRFYAKPKPLPAGAVTSDWPRFLGPTHDGKSPETKLLAPWPEDGPNLVWEVKKGTGFASPVVAGGRVILFHRLGDEEVVECLDGETGRLFWKYAYPSTYVDRYGFSNGPRATPVIDGRLVYTHGVQGKLHAFDLQSGKMVWQRDIATDYRVPQNFFGDGSSPLIEGNLLIVNVGAPGGPCVVALNKKNGKPVWQVGDQWGASYASPIPITINGKRRVLVFAGGESDPPTGGLLSIDPIAGKIDARFPFRGKNPISVNAVSPVLVEGKVFLTTSYKTGCTLVDVAIGGAKAVWHSDTLESHFSTPVYVDGFLYGFHGSGRDNTKLVCMDAKTGKRKWRVMPEFLQESEVNGKRVVVTLTPGRGSLIHADGGFFCLGEVGHLLRMELAPAKYRIVSKVRLFAAEETWCPPVLSRGLLYVMQNTRDKSAGTPPRLLCYDLRGEE
ncbi:MAG: PQQ-like beta-propeller repeat protein [Planctomycetes bacterium]|nr:PQQ-like beta-propeller repeat protein [Planctomycetota bacterium]